jgi:uncharacterized protein HemX
MKLAVQIAAGILLAAVLIGVGRYVFLMAGLSYFASTMQQVQSDMMRDTARMQAQRDAKERERQRLTEQARVDRLRANAAQMRVQVELAQSAQEQATRKAAAWEAFYKPRKDCSHPADWNAQVACGNEYIRAKREFEKRWAQRQFE